MSHRHALGQCRNIISELNLSQVVGADTAGSAKIISENRDISTAVLASELAAEKIIGWFQGKSEWGPRALGNRSILADPRNKKMRDHININVKHREIFRPFAPSILEEFGNDFFEKSLYKISRYFFLY